MSDRASTIRRIRRGLVALARERLRRTPGARVGGFLSILAAVGLSGLMVYLQLTEDSESTPLSLLVLAARYLAWAAGGLVALAAAHDRASDDARDGIDALAEGRGVPTGALEAARVAAAMIEVALVVGAPLVLMTLTVVALSPSAAAIEQGAEVLAAVLAFAAAMGIAVGGLGAFCSRAGGRRGRWLLVLLVLGPWVVGDLVGHAAWSIPGALDAMLLESLRLALNGATG